jgi:hypothetical protein
MKLGKHSGISMMQTHRQLCERTGQTMADFGEPQIGAAAYIWELYCDMRQGDATITYTLIHDYVSVTGLSLEGWEMATILAIEGKRRRA